MTGDYLIYTYNRGSRADLQVTLADDPDSLLLTIEGNGTYPTTMLAGTDDRSGTPLLLVSRYELIDRGAEYSVYDLSTLELATNSMLDSAKLQRLGYCFGKNGDEIVCFNNCLRFDPFRDVLRRQQPILSERLLYGRLSRELFQHHLCRKRLVLLRGRGSGRRDPCH